MHCHEWQIFFFFSRDGVLPCWPRWPPTLDLLAWPTFLILKNIIRISPFLGWVWWVTPVIPALWEVKAGRSPEIRSSRPAWPWPTWQNLISTKNTKSSWAWWHAPVIPATQEAEAGRIT
uniref:Uncharacterized protein n=1 Tax=Macaca fascicularis TaxID=9541 RepID=A0A7N9CB63_MACFA